MSTQRPATTWHLYLDESGSFGDLDAPVCVGGVLARDDIPGFSPERIRSALNVAAAGFPWPWHARWLNQPAWVALALVAEARRGARYAKRIQPASLEAATTAVEHLFVRVGPAAREALRQISARRPVTHETVRACSSLLREQRPDAVAVLEHHTRRAWDAVRAVCAALAEAAAVAEDAEGALLVVTSETRVGDAAPHEDVSEERIDSHRYLHLLSLTIERAACVVGRRAGAHELLLHVLERHVVHPTLSGRVQLQLPMLREVASSVAPFAPSNVKMVASEVADYGQETGVRFVIADFVTNRARRHLDRPSWPLADVEGTLRADFALPPRSGRPVRSHLAASGEALAIIRQGAIADEGHPASPFARPGRRWAREQALEWAGLA